MSAYVSIRGVSVVLQLLVRLLQHTSAYVRIRQLRSAYVSIRGVSVVLHDREDVNGDLLVASRAEAGRAAGGVFVRRRALAGLSS
jgi:hypothetical protein